MRRMILAGATAAALFVPALVDARGAGHSASHSSTYCSACGRDSNGHIARSETAKKAFMTQTGHPNGWPGHVVDHVDPLKRGGADTPANMQWQTKSEAKAKDKWE
jgi:hypothetical protein